MVTSNCPNVTRFKTRTPFKIRPQTWALRVTLDTVGGGPIVFRDSYPTLLRQGDPKTEVSLAREGSLIVLNTSELARWDNMCRQGGKSLAKKTWHAACTPLHLSEGSHHSSQGVIVCVTKTVAKSGSGFVVVEIKLA
jgi:hypothetical protein